MATTEQLKDVLRVVTLAGAAMVGAALALSFLAPFWPFADSLAHFRLHLSGALAAAAALLAVLGRVRVSLGAAAFLALIAALGFRPAFPANIDGRERSANVTFLQLNLLFRNANHAGVLALIDRENPDLIAFQEMSHANRPLLDALRADYPFQSVCPFAGVGAVAVLSRFPKADTLSTSGGVQGCYLRRGVTWMRVQTQKGPLTVASLHLHWPYPYSQSEQVDDIAASLIGVARPVVLGGDFNAAPWSHSPSAIAEATGARVLPGLRFTWHRRILPFAPPLGLPIDHVLADPKLEPVTIAVSEPVGSDHRAVIARLAWR